MATPIPIDMSNPILMARKLNEAEASMRQQQPAPGETQRQAVSAGTSVTKTVDPAGAVDATLAYSEESTKAQQIIDTNNASRFSLADQIVEATKTQGEAKLKVDSYARSVALDAQNKTLKALDPTKTTAILTDLNKQLADASVMAAQKQKEASDNANITVADDGFFPWLGSLFAQGFYDEEADQAAKRVQTLGSTVDTIREAGADTAQAVAQMQVAVTSDTVLSMNKQQKAALDAQVMKQQADNIIANNEAITKSLEAKGKEVDYRLRAMSAETQRVNANRMSYASLRDEKKWDEMTKIINRARGTAGVNLLTPFQVEAAVQASNPDILTQFHVGFRLLNQDEGGTRAIGVDFADAMDITGEIKAEDFRRPLAINTFGQRVQQAAGKASVASASVRLEDLDPTNRKAFIQDAYKNLQESDAALIADKNNIYAVPKMAVLAGQADVADTQLYKNVLQFAPVDDAPNQDAATVEAAFDAAFKDPKKPISPAQAAKDLARIYKAGSLVKAEQNDFIGYHIPVIDSYIVELNASALTEDQAAGAWGVDTMLVDLTDPTSILTYFKVKASKVNNLGVLFSPSGAQ